MTARPRVHAPRVQVCDPMQRGFVEGLVQPARLTRFLGGVGSRWRGRPPRRRPLLAVVEVSDRPRCHLARRVRSPSGVRRAQHEKVKVDWAFDTTEVALWLVIAVSAAAGFVIGYLARPRRR